MDNTKDRTFQLGRRYFPDNPHFASVTVTKVREGSIRVKTTTSLGVVSWNMVVKTDRSGVQYATDIDTGATYNADRFQAC